MPDCIDCKHRAIDMDMDPFCVHPSVRATHPWGRTLVGKSSPRLIGEVCSEGKLWEKKDDR